MFHTATCKNCNSVRKLWYLLSDAITHSCPECTNKVVKPKARKNETNMTYSHWIWKCECWYESDGYLITLWRRGIWLDRVDDLLTYNPMSNEEPIILDEEWLDNLY